MKERLWYPPNSFAHVPHWELQVLRVTGEWRTYTEHPTADNARAHQMRLADRWPNSQTRILAL
jgi:predicted FMN-binding regulatory protein PaiB